MNLARKHKKKFTFSLAKTFIALAILFSFAGGFVYSTPHASAKVPGSGGSTTPPPDKANNGVFETGGVNKTKYQCGNGDNAVYTSIDIGCRGDNCTSGKKGGCSAITDMAFAIIRVVSDGVGLVIIGSMIWAGIQYTTSRDDPSAVGKAKERVLNNIIALFVYIFAYAILNYVIPRGFFQ